MTARPSGDTVPHVQADILEPEVEDLNRKIRQLECLTRICRLDETCDTMQELLRTAVDLIPDGCRYPDMTGARIVFNDHDLETPYYKGTALHKRFDLIVDRKQQGHIVLGYRNELAGHRAASAFREDQVLVKDISSRLSAMIELKQARLMVEEKIDLFHQVIENIPIMLDAFDENGNIVLWNHEAENVSGYRADEIIGNPKAMNLMYPNPEIHKIRTTMISQCNTDFRNREWKLRCKDGSFKAISLSNISSRFPIPGWKSWFIGIDVTPIRKAREALTESEQRLSQIINFLPDATMAIDITGHVIVWNKAVEKMTGIKAKDMLGKGNFEYSIPFYGKRRPIAIDMVCGAKNHDSIQNSYDKMKKEKDYIIAETGPMIFKGKETYLWGKASPIYDANGNIVGAIESIRDVTERRKAQEDLKYSEEKFRSVFAQSPIGIALCDSNFHLIDFNRSALELFGIQDPEAIKGKDMSLDPNAPNAMTNRIRRRKTIQYESIYDFEKIKSKRFYKSSKSGTMYLNTLITRLGSSGSGMIDGILLQYQDITRRKQAERQIHELTQRLIKAQESERQRISRYLHDKVAQDLSSIKIGCDTLFDECLQIPENMSEKISGWSKVLQETISVVRDMSYDLHPSGLDQLGLIQTLYKHCDEFEETTGIRTEFGSAGLDDLILDFDTQINIYRVIQEALNNIARHSNASRALVKIVASYPKIIVRIEDNGKGFDTNRRDFLFSREKHMGLRSMQERIWLLNGTFQLQSQPMKGTKIYIEIPHYDSPD